MTTTSKPIQTRGLLAASLFSLLAGGMLSPEAEAGTVNVNFTDTSATVTGVSDGTGVLGGGIWTRIINDQGTTPFTLNKNNSVLSGMTLANDVTPLGDTQAANNNPVQSESWFSLSGLNLTLGGLVPNGSYRLACYSDVDGFIGFVSPTTLYTANGVSGTTLNGSASVRSLPGTAGVDYVLLTTKANAAGQIVLTCAQIAGLQIQGVFSGENGPKMDCMITRAAGSSAGKGRGVFGINPNPLQTLTQSSKGQKTKTSFVNVKNSGAEFDRGFLMAFPDRGAKIRVIDQTLRKNVTAAAKALRHRFDISAGQTKRFTVQLSSATAGQTAPLSVGIGASPSTLKRPKQDVVYFVLTP